MHIKLWMLLYNTHFSHPCPLYPNIIAHSKLTTNYEILETHTYKNVHYICQVKVLVPGLHPVILVTHTKYSLFKITQVKSWVHAVCHAKIYWTEITNLICFITVNEFRCYPSVSVRFQTITVQFGTTYFIILQWKNKLLNTNDLI